ncbi:MAG: hypothetical protein EON89_02550 [Brevundimonas sp.]|nr:MAG: hypothetical protein EON89_02550 [Brevundimonas sp.]
MKTIIRALAFAACAVSPALAQDAASDQPVEVMRAADLSLNCVQIADQASELSEIMGERANGGVFGRLGGVAKAGAAMVIPGAGLVTAAADALTQGDRDARLARERAVEQRWYYLSGLYTGRRCEPLPETAAAAPAATAATPPAVATTPAPAIRPATLPADPRP